MPRLAGDDRHRSRLASLGRAASHRPEGRQVTSTYTIQSSRKDRERIGDDRGENIFRTLQHLPSHIT